MYVFLFDCTKTNIYVPWLSLSLSGHSSLSSITSGRSSTLHPVSIHSCCRECPRGVMVKAMDCGIVVSEFILRSRYYVHFRTNTFGKGMKPLILPSMGWIIPLLFFYENGFGIKYPTKVDMPLNKETKPNQTRDFVDRF